MPRQTPQMCTTDGTEQFIHQNNLHSSHQCMPSKGRDKEQSILLPPSQRPPSQPTVSQPPLPFTARKKDADPHRITAALGANPCCSAACSPATKPRRRRLSLGISLPGTMRPQPGRVLNAAIVPPPPLHACGVDPGNKKKYSRGAAVVGKWG